jgi:hypothetical protein
LQSLINNGFSGFQNTTSALMKDGKNRTHRQQSVALFIYSQIFQPIPILMKGQEAKPKQQTCDGTV